MSEGVEISWLIGEKLLTIQTTLYRIDTITKTKENQRVIIQIH